MTSTIDTRTPAEPPVNLIEYEMHARTLLSPSAYSYVAGASAQEITNHANRSRFDEIRLAPRVLRDVSHIDTTLELFGRRLEFPVLLAPTAFHKLMHPEAELATVRGARAAETLLVASTLANTRIEDMCAAAAGHPLWFQLYVQRDRDFTLELVKRAEAHGYRAIVLTADTPLLGARDREQRRQLELPRGMELPNLRGLAERSSEPTFQHGTRNPFLDPSLTWKDLEWLARATKLPVIVKGVLHARDAQLAVDHGAAAIGVSNHGGRNLDTVPATIDALPTIAAVVGNVPILFDGGVRRGVDVVKAVALGASAVMIGRPYLWGLAAAGAEGVTRVVHLLVTELEMAMAQCGAASLGAIHRELVLHRDPGGS